MTDTPDTKAPKFPTVIRKMWSGGEVQAWIDENWKAQSPWLDVSDPPEVGRLVFVDSSGMLPVVAYMDDLGAWYSETTKMWVLNVTRWMPIPT